MKTNYIIFILLSILIIIGSTLLLGPNKQERLKRAEEKKAAELALSPIPTPNLATPLGAAPITTPAFPAENSSSRLITVKTPLFTGVIDTLGARIVKLSLNQFKASTKKDSPLVDVLHDTPGAPSTRLFLDGIKIPNPIPFSYAGADVVEVRNGKAELSFKWKSNDGILIKKTYVIDPKSYMVEHSFEVENGTNSRITELVTVEWSAKMIHHGKRSEYNRQFIALVSDKVDRVRKKPKEKKTFSGTISWFGFSDKYFMAAFLPEVGGDTSIVLAALNDNSLVGAQFSYPQDSIPAGQSSLKVSKLYLGPMKLDLLTPLGDGLNKAINYGWIGFLAKPTLSLLKFLNRWLENYGIAIIVITLLLRVLFLPLTIKSMESMKEMQNKMQLLKPKIDELKEKFKSDKTQQNQELMKLYSAHGVNPLSSLGGCLPMLIQVPVFIALYEVLLYSIELRHSTFLWINNLAEPEHLFNIPGIGVPFRILPLIMGVSWYASQKLTPTSAPTSDNMQMKIMEYMPIIFTVMFWGLPSGLILYWTVSNILSIAQQLYVNHRIAKKGRA